MARSPGVPKKGGRTDRTDLTDPTNRTMSGGGQFLGLRTNPNGEKRERFFGLLPRVPHPHPSATLGWDPQALQACRRSALKNLRILKIKTEFLHPARRPTGQGLAEDR